MSFKSILLALPSKSADSTAAQSAGRFALEFAKDNGGFVQGLLLPAERGAAGPKVSRPATSTMMPQESLGAAGPSQPAGVPGASPAPDPQEQLSERARTAFRNLCDAQNVEFSESSGNGKLPAASWHSALEGGLDDVIERETLCHDLVVLPAPSAVAAAERVAKRCLTEARKPVLVAPSSAKGGSDKVRSKILIAWDGGPQAWHAVAAALPFLREAETVDVLTVDSPKGIVSSRAKLLHYLACHGIDASAYDQPSRSLSAGEAILGDASDGEYGLLIMGAYTRGPIRERLKAGATRHILNHAAATRVFLAH